MRLHLDTNNSAGATGAANATGPERTSAASATGGHGGPSAAGLGSRDSVAVSSASSAWAASFPDRAARVGQLAAVVQNGSYYVSSAAVSQAIVASAIS